MSKRIYSAEEWAAFAAKQKLKQDIPPRVRATTEEWAQYREARAKYVPKKRIPKSKPIPLTREQQLALEKYWDRLAEQIEEREKKELLNE